MKYALIIWWLLNQQEWLKCGGMMGEGNLLHRTEDFSSAPPPPKQFLPIKPHFPTQITITIYTLFYLWESGLEESSARLTKSLRKFQY